MCDKIHGEICILENECQKKHQSGRCEFPGHYRNLLIKTSDRPLVKKLKERMYASFMKNWTDFTKNPKSGMKRMTGDPFEKTIREIFKEKLTPFGATVWPTGRKFAPKGIADICGIVDCLIEKEGRPKSIISAKTWLGAEQVRETFATAYFAKFHYGQQGIRAFMVVYLPFDRNQEWEQACRPYLDGIYAVAAKLPIRDSTPLYIDDLLEELHNIYAN